MCHFQPFFLSHDNINFDVILIAGVVCSSLRSVREYHSVWKLDAYSVNLLDPRIMSDRDIDQLVQEVLRSTFANQEPHVLKSRRGPREENQASDADGADRVKEPDFFEFCSDDGHDQSEDVDEDIISVVKLIKRLAFVVPE